MRNGMSSIKDLMGPELSELFALEFAKILNLCLLCNIYKWRPVSSKHGHTRHDNEVLDEFGYGSNPTVRSGVICS